MNFQKKKNSKKNTVGGVKLGWWLGKGKAKAN